MKKRTKIIIAISSILAIIVLLIGIYILFATEQYTCTIREIEGDTILVKSTQTQRYYIILLNKVFIKLDKDFKVGDTIYIIEQKEIAKPDIGSYTLIEGEEHSFEYLRNGLLIKLVKNGETNLES